MQIAEDRRALHQIPELDKDLPKTFAFLRNALSNLKCQVFSPCEEAVCAFFDFGARRAIAFRSDADALPIQECSNASYASTHPGKMHACGHDGHMAILLEVARRLDQMESLNKNILLVFQAAEETTGGARKICASNVFTKYHVDAIFGLHIWPGLPEGLIYSRLNEMMARSCEVKVDVEGKSAHIAKAEDGCDALAAGVEFYTRVMKMAAAMPKNIYRVLNFGKFESGTVCNAISGHTHMEGSLRTFQDEVFYSMRAEIVSIAKDVERSTGCSITVDMSEGYPAILNPADLHKRVRRAVGFFELEKPSMTTEDFSWYQKTLPGMFFFLGAGDVPALHTSNFDFDEEILLKGVEFFEDLAVNY